MSSTNNLEIICGASLYWETTLWQRPHQIMSRFAEDNNVLYIRPLDFRMYWKNRNKWSREIRFGSPLKNLHLYSPLILPWSQHPLVRTINNSLMTSRVARQCRQEKQIKKILWLYSPMSNYLIGNVEEALVVYDCMDDHAAFRNANPQLEAQENILLQKADIVFTGGRSLYESRKNKNKNTYLFPSAVDPDHFANATKESTPIPHDMKGFTKPIIGYFGAIDERLDYALIEDLAEKNPHWSFVLIGPVLKVSEQELSHRENIHYLGKKEYKELPAYLAHFNAGLMAFAMNKSTEKISPTKTLEYMAAGCRVVSTPVQDVLSEYNGLIGIGHNTNEITNHLKTILTQKEPERIEQGKALARRNSWDQTVSKMKSIISEKLNQVEQ